MRPAPRSRRRPAITLLEVIVATAVFLFAMSALLRLASFAEARAVDIRQKTRATELAQSKMAEIVAGIVPLSTSGAQPFEDSDSDYQWSVTANESTQTAGLYAVTVTVTHPKMDGSTMQVSMDRMVLTPSYRGNIAVPGAPPLDSNTTPTPLAGATSNSSSNSNSSSSSPTNPAGSPAKPGGAAAPASPARAAPPAPGGNRAGAGAGARGGAGAGAGARGGAGTGGGRGGAGAGRGGAGAAGRGGAGR